MISPAWLADILAAVAIAVAVFSLARLVAARGRRRRCEVDADGMHAVMGVAMAGMLVPRLATLPDPVWGAVFAAGAGWFGWRAIRSRRVGLALPPGAGLADGGGHSRLGLTRDCCPYPVPHLIDCLAMVYALFAVPAIAAARAPGAGGGMGGMSGAGGGASFPVIGLVLAVGACGYVVWLADRIQRFAAVPATVSVGGASTPIAAVAAMGRPEAAGLVSPPPHGQHAAALLAPRTATCCKIAMGVAMVVMLIDLL
jgi:hypothetical protein